MMNVDEQLERIVNSVLYEGYLLYPYRRSLKNARRWTFGALYPENSPQVRAATERGEARARVLVTGNDSTIVAAELRFLHLIERRAVADRDDVSLWHEAGERRIALPAVTLGDLLSTAHRQQTDLPAHSWNDGNNMRRQSELNVRISLSAARFAGRVHLLQATIANATPCDDAARAPTRVLASAHVVLRCRDGAFVSRIDPPEAYRSLCPHEIGDGLWPVLVGSPTSRDTMLCSPIILYDHPEVAAESAGDFFDATEIDEMLTLRVLTLTDDEKREMAELDSRGRLLLERIAAMSERQVAALHGTTRGIRAVED